MLCNDLLADWSNEKVNFREDGEDSDAEEEDEYFRADEEVAILVATAFPTESFGCHCHHLELVMKHGLECVFELYFVVHFFLFIGLLSKLEDVREFARLTRNDSSVRNYVAGCVGSVPYLPADGTTRWSSTHRLIHAFIKHKDSWTKA